jgi:WD40 repeat protein
MPPSTLCRFQWNNGSFKPILQKPLQTYCSIVFTPEDSIVRKKFISYIPKWITRLPQVQKDWGAALQILEGHTEAVSAMTFSPDGKQVVSGSWDNTVRLWDAATGTVLQTLEEHTDVVGVVTFSPDGKQVASASDDTTVRLWDAATGAALQTLEGHTDQVTAVGFSTDSNQIASASDDRIIRLWNVATGAAFQTLEGHTDQVTAVGFSPDSNQIASASDDKTIKLWDAATGAVLWTLKYTGIVPTLSFSTDGSRLQSDGGFFPLYSHAVNILPQSAYLSDLLIKHEWIARRKVNLLWLPHEYREVVTAVFRDVKTSIRSYFNTRV